MELAKLPDLKQLSRLSTGIIKNGQIQVHRIFEKPQLSTLILQHGKTNIKKLLAVLLDDFVMSFKTANRMTPTEYSSVLDNIIMEYWNLRLEDFALFFNRAKTGIYGKIFNRIDQEVLFGMLDEYVKQRSKDIEQKHEQQKAVAKKKSPQNEKGRKKF